MRETAFIELGSNCEESEQMLLAAQAAIARLPGLDIEKASAIYYTEPQDYLKQPWFANMALKLSLEVNWKPESLLENLLHIETELGRQRDAHCRFGPRKIDIDLLLFGERDCCDSACIVPHPRMTRRAFVLIPLLELAPELVIGGRSAKDWLQRLNYRAEGNRIWQKQGI